MALQDIGVRAVVDGLAGFKTSIDEMISKTKSYTDQSALGFTKAKLQVDEFAKSIGTTSTKLGVGLAAAGAAITASLGLAAKSAANEEVAMLRLSVALKNVGVDFESVKDPLDKTIMAMEQATKVGHDELYESLISLTNITHDYKKSLDLLPLALDLARGKNMDLATASLLIGKVATGNTDLLARYGIELKKGATAVEALGELQQVYGGQAVKYGQSTSGALDGIKNSTESLSESIGKNLLPLILTTAKVVSDIINKITEWTTANPLLTKVLVLAAGAVGLLLAGTGALILALPTLITLQASATAVMSGAAIKTALQTAALLAQAAAQTVLAVATKATAVAIGIFNAAIAGNPIGIIVMAITAAAIGFGAFKLAQNAVAKSTDDLTTSVKNYVPPATEAQQATKLWVKYLSDLNDINQKIVSDEALITEINTKVGDSYMTTAASLDTWIKLSKGSSAIAQEGATAEEKWITASQGHTAANDAFAKSILAKTGAISDQDAQFLILYRNAIEANTAIDKATQSQLQAVSDFNDKIDSLKKTYDDATAKAQNFGLGVDDVVNYMLAAGRATELTNIPLDRFADVTQNAKTMADYFGVSLQTIAQAAKEADAATKALDFAANVSKLSDAYKFAQTEAGRLGINLENIITYLLAQGHSVDEVDAAFAKYGTDVAKWASGMQLNLNEVALVSKATSGSMVVDAEEFTKKAKELAAQYIETEKSKLDDVLSAERDAHQKRLDDLQTEYDAAITNIDTILQKQLDAYDEQLAALDEQLKRIDDAEKANQDTRKKTDLETAIGSEYDLKRKADLNRQLDQLILDSGNKTWQQQRKTQLEALAAAETDVDVKKNLQDELAAYTQDLATTTQKADLEGQKDTIVKEKTAAQKKADDDKAILEANYKTAKAIEDQAFIDFTTDIKNRKTALDNELIEAQTRYDTDLLAFKKANSDKIADTVAFVNSINGELDRLQARTIPITIVYVPGTAPESASVVYGTVPESASVGQTHGLLTMAEGGVVKARPGGQMVRAGEAGEDEYFIPRSKLWGFTSNLLRQVTPPTQKVILPLGTAGKVSDNHSVNYNIRANYSRPQEPQSLRLDLEAIAMMARS